MCNSISTDKKHNDENLVHSGSETNIGFINLHSENVYHGIKMITVLIGLLLVTTILIKCNPILKKLYKKGFKKEKALNKEFQHYLSEKKVMCYPCCQDRRSLQQNNQLQAIDDKVPMIKYKGSQLDDVIIHPIKDSNPIYNQVPMMEDKGCQTEFRIDPPQFQETKV